MTIATERDISLLQSRYGIETQAVDGLLCFPNAVKAATKIFTASNEEELPEIWVMRNERGLVHAYLAHKGIVYNRKVTWKDNRYRDYTYEQLRHDGVDDTVKLYAATLLGVIGEGNENNALLANAMRLALPKTTSTELTRITHKALLIAIGREEDLDKITPLVQELAFIDLKDEQA